MSKSKKPNLPKPTDASAVDYLPDEERLALRATCERTMWGHGIRTPAEMLAEISSLGSNELSADFYGSGGTVAILEEEVRSLLGKPAAVFMPSGTMIQQIALRIHADRRNRRVVAFHPTCHLELHEDQAYQRLHGLVGRPVGNADALISLADLEEVHEPLAALLLELPQREIGGALPAWKDLKVQVNWAHERGAAVHLDGARLWACGPFYDRTPAQIAALFDTVYVSFYKDMGGTAGGMLLGEEDVIAQAREWRHRHGGTLPALWPEAAAALAGVRLRLPRVGQYVAHARAIAGALAFDGVAVVPDPPPTNMMHIYLRTTAADVIDGIRRLAAEDKLWAFSGSMPADVPGYRRLELSVGDATLAFTPQEVAHAVASFLPRQ